MNKVDVIRAMSEITGLSRPDAKAALKAFSLVIVNAMKAGDTVQVTGFATFKPFPQPAKMVPNPRTREMMLRRAHTRVNTKFSRKALAYIDEGLN